MIVKRYKLLKLPTIEKKQKQVNFLNIEFNVLSNLLPLAMQNIKGPKMYNTC